MRTADELTLRVRIGRGGTALLVGWGGAQFLLGWSGVCRSVFDPLPQTTLVVLAAGLLAVALGPWVPQGLIHFVYAPLRTRANHNHRIAPRRPDGSTRAPARPAPVVDAEDDRIVLVGATCCLLGVLIALSPIFVGLFARAGAYVEERFLWTPATIGIADAALAWLSQLPIGALLGLAVASLLGVESPRDDRSPGGGRLGGMLTGAGLCGLLACGPMGGVSSRVQLLLASVPLFAAATVSLTCLAGPRPARRDSGSRTLHTPDQPQVDAAGLSALLVGIGVWTLSAVLAAPVWLHAGRLAWGLRGIAPEIGVAVWLIAIGLGAVLFRSREDDAQRTLTHCGLRLWLAGVAALMATLLIRAGAEPAGAEALITLGPARLLSAIVLHGLLAGQALPALMGAAQCRFATRAIAQAKLVTVLATAAGLGLALAACWMLPRYGSFLVISASALGALMGGGLLIIYEPRRGPGASRAPLALVFGTLAVMTVVLPRAAAHWSLDLPLTVVQERGESRWQRAGTIPGRTMTAAATVSPTGGTAAAPRTVEELLTRLVATGGRMRVIDDAFTPPDRVWTRHLSALEFVRLDGSTGRAGWRGDRLLRSVRLERAQFDLLVLGSCPPGDPDNRLLWSREMLARLLRCVSPHGWLLVRVPRAAVTDSDVDVLAATVAAASAQEQALWVRPPEAITRDEIWLAASPRGDESARRRLEDALGAAHVGRLEDLSAAAVHSLDQPRLSAVDACAARAAHPSRRAPIADDD